MAETWQLWIYHLESLASGLVQAQLQHVSWVSFGVIALAGLLTSLSPCMLSMLPVMVGYVGGYSTDRPVQNRLAVVGFALGLATTLMGLGLAAALLGKVYGQTGSLSILIVGSVSLVMGLNLLEVIRLPLPDWFAQVQVSERLPGWLRAYSVGLLFGVTASPCSTPVLVALLSWVSTSRDPWIGAAFLFAYALGMLLPLVVAGLFTGVIQQLLRWRRWSTVMTTVSGVILVVVGTLTLVQVWL